MEENKEGDKKQKSDVNKNNKKLNIQRAINKKKTTLVKELQLNTGELKKKNRKTIKEIRCDRYYKRHKQKRFLHSYFTM